MPVDASELLGACSGESLLRYELEIEFSFGNFPMLLTQYGARGYRWQMGILSLKSV